MKSNKIRKNLDFWLYVFPALFLVTIVTFIPFIMNFYTSMTSWDGISSEQKFIGLENFIALFHDKDFWGGPMWFTIRYAVVYVILANVIGLAFALLFTMNLKTASVLRAMLYLPNVISMIMVGYVWKFIFGTGFKTLLKITGWKVFELSWLGDTTLVFWALMFVSIWNVVGFYCIIYIAGIQSLPGDIMESAVIDGAGKAKKFFYVTLPMLIPSVTVCLFTSMLGGFKVFDLPYILTSGGPARASTSLALEIHTETFKYNHYGYGTAKALVFFVMVAIVTILQVKFTKSREVEA